MTANAFNRIAAGLLATVAALPADAAPVALENPGFEDQRLPDGGYQVGYGPTGWSGGYASPTGPLNPPASDFTAIPEGENVLFSATGLDPNPYQGTNYQQVSESLLANTRYTFSIDVGRSTAIDMAEFVLEFSSAFSGGLVYASTSFAANSIAAGTFQTLTLTFDSLIARDTPFGIRLRTFYNPEQGGNQRITYFDNARLDASPIVAAPVPEPASWALMIMGFGATGVAMRRRRRPALPSVA